jgi:hypothetical protein
MKPYRDAVHKIVISDLADKYSEKVMSTMFVASMNQLIKNAAAEER